jgi:uncharacterized protein
MNVVIPGGTGQIGAVLGQFLVDLGHDVVVLGRNSHARAIDPRIRYATWDANTLGPWIKEIDGADVVINLAGRSVNCRYTSKNRAEILESRVNSTCVVGEAIAQAAHPPKLWLQAATATIYQHRFDAANDDITGSIVTAAADMPDTWWFSIEVALAWEHALWQADTPHTRKIALRSAMVMDPYRDGVFWVLSNLVRSGLGGAMGTGKQYISWIHERDFCRSMVFLLEHPELSGAINIASPNPLPNREFMRVLRQEIGVPFGLPANEWMLELGAYALRTETELVLKSRRVVPQRLVDAGFQFEFPDWPEAVKDLLARA